jgi:metal-responsive CopG/Arc/MetJ family transcriptional regulator
MPSVKTAISIPEPLFQRAEAVAHSLQISRSQLIARAVAEFVKRYENRSLLESLNRAYEDSPSAEEREQMQSMRQKQWELMKGEW